MKKEFQHFIGALAVFALSVGVERVSAQSAPARSETETLAVRMLAVINGGDPVAAREFVRSHFSERSQESLTNEIVALFQKIKLQSGGLDIVKVLPPEMRGQANLLLRTRKEKHFVRLVVFTRDGKLTDFFPLAATDPKGDISNDW